MLMPAFLRGPSRLFAPLSAALALVAAPAAAEEAKRTVALVVAKPADAKPEAPAAPDDRVVAVRPVETKESPAEETTGPKHRSGFVVGIGLGTGVTAFSGYPND